MPVLHEAPDFNDIIQTHATSPEHSSHRRHEQAPNRWRRARRGIARTAIGSVVTIGALTGALQYDIHQGREAAEQSEPSIEHIYSPVDASHDNSATIVLAGFGTRSAEDIAERLRSHAETGHVFALKYSNDDIDIAELTTLVTDAIETQTHTIGAEHHDVNFDGYSMGGSVLTSVAAEVHVNEPDIIVTGDVLNSTPIGEDGLKSRSSESIELMSGAIDVCNRIKLCAGIEYSRAVHHIVELASRHNNYYDSTSHQFDVDSFRTTAQQVRDKLSGDDAPSLALAYHQAGVLEGASNDLLRDAQQAFHSEYGIEQSIEALSKPAHGKPPVPIFYTMAEHPEYDPIVNVATSAQALQTIADKHGAELSIVPLSVSHVNIYETAQEYNNFITSHVNPTARSVASQGQIPPQPYWPNQVYTPLHRAGFALGGPSQIQSGQ